MLNHHFFVFGIEVSPKILHYPTHMTCDLKVKNGAPFSRTMPSTAYFLCPMTQWKEVLFGKTLLSHQNEKLLSSLCIKSTFHITHGIHDTEEHVIWSRNMTHPPALSHSGMNPPNSHRARGLHPGRSPPCSRTLPAPPWFPPARLPSVSL